MTLCVFMFLLLLLFFFFFFNDTATTEIYTLSLHDALPIYIALHLVSFSVFHTASYNHQFCIPFSLSLFYPQYLQQMHKVDRKSTRLNSSHQIISYAVFCLKKKKTNNITMTEVGGSSIA